jgi:uncharacterized protein
MEVRDPIHGPIPVTQAEVALLDHPFVQRMRHVQAVGFTSLPFPGATHTRYAHSVGAAHLAGIAFDSAYSEWSFAKPAKRAAFRELVRATALCHDLGHGPMSHCSEFAMPRLSSLHVPFYDNAKDRRATHEDYTLAILAGSLSRCISDHFRFTARHVAALISPDVRVGDDFFLDGGLDHRRLLSQIISSELDVDRLDYLVRDATYSGVRYGLVDVTWLLSNLTAWPKDGEVCLGLDHSAIYAFDDFIIARHHMFLMVYFHHRAVCYEEMLRRYAETSGEWTLPSSLDEYLHMDDGALWALLRRSKNPWARRIATNDIYKRVVEKHGTPEQVSLTRERKRLEAEGIDVIEAAATGRLSRYFVRGRRTPRLYVIDRFTGARPRAQLLADATDVYDRYADARCIARLYVPPDDADRAKALL